MEKWEDWRIALQFSQAQSFRALYWPVTSTKVFGGGGLTSCDPVGERLNILKFVRITLTLAAEPLLKELIPRCGAGDSTRPVKARRAARRSL